MLEKICPGRDEEEVVPGYTVARVKRAAQKAVWRHRGRKGADYTWWMDIAWSEIALALCEGERPTDEAMAKVGFRGIDAEFRAQLRHAITGLEDVRVGSRMKPRPRFLMYWRPVLPTPWEENPFIEQLSVRQVTALMEPADLEALSLLDREGTMQAVADSLGVSIGTVHARVKKARLAFTRGWFAPDPAPPLRRASKGRLGPYTKTCREGHPLEGENLAVRWQGGYRCKVCDREQARETKARNKAQADGAQSGNSSTS